MYVSSQRYCVHNALEECGQVFLCANARALFRSLCIWRARIFSCFTFTLESADACTALKTILCFRVSAQLALYCMCAALCSRTCMPATGSTLSVRHKDGGIKARYTAKMMKKLAGNSFRRMGKYSSFMCRCRYN